MDMELVKNKIAVMTAATPIPTHSATMSVLTSRF